MPQLDVMTFYIQGFSVFLSVFITFFFFYVYFLPSISLSLFSRFLLKKKYSLDKRLLKLNFSKLKNRVIIVNAYLLLYINQHLVLIDNFLSEGLRLKKEILYKSFLDEYKEELETVLHQSNLWFFLLNLKDFLNQIF